MATSIEDLPVEMLEKILGYIDGSKDICNLSETCKNFRNIVANSEKITRKLTLHLSYPDDLNEFTRSISNSPRRYRNLKISKKQPARCDNARTPARRNVSILEFLNNSIEVLTIVWSNVMNTREVLFEAHRHRSRIHFAFHRQHPLRQDAEEEQNIAARALANVREIMFNEFLEILSSFGNVHELNLQNVHLEKMRTPNDADVNFNKLTTLNTQECDGFCFALLKSVNTLQRLSVKDASWGNRNPGISDFESFLFAQSNLKDLKLTNLYMPRFLQTNRIDEIQFKLDHLTLLNVYFASKEIASEFFKSQDQLKTINFQIYNEKARNLDEINFFNNSLRSIVGGRCTQLTSIELSKVQYKMDQCDFLDHISNSNVRILKFHVTSEDKQFELFKSLIRIFTRLEIIEFKADEFEEPAERESCFNDGTVLTCCHSLTIRNSSIRSLMGVYAPVLTHFEYAPDSPGEFIDNYFVGFFHRHRNIRNLIIGNRNRRSYVFVTLKLVEIITNYLEHLEHITIYSFESVNKSVKLLCEMSQLKTITISTDDYQQFTAKTKVECNRKNLKLIHVNIGTKRWQRDGHASYQVEST
jgi:hypothetical protein